VAEHVCPPPCAVGGSKGVCACVCVCGCGAMCLQALHARAILSAAGACVPGSAVHHGDHCWPTPPARGTHQQVKCLNPNLLVPDGAMGSFSRVGDGGAGCVALPLQRTRSASARAPCAPARVKCDRGVHMCAGVPCKHALAAACVGVSLAHRLQAQPPHAPPVVCKHNTTTPQHHNTTTPQHHNTTTPPQDNVSELLKEASILGSVRHPNVVWV
jgi:hypothetical protein